jgi:L-ribulokinase
MSDPTSTLVLGLDYGTDSCRGVLIDARDGSELGSAVAAYPRWTRGEFCDPARNRFRQHPLDYLEALEAMMDGLAESVGSATLAGVRALALDTTASTPCAVDARASPLSLSPAFSGDPDALFVLWKDHTALAEAEEINALARSWGGTDWTKYEGGTYSSEWFWAKVLHVLRTNPAVAAAAASFVEHGDWMTALLTGVRDIAGIRRGRCAMGHKAMWHADFGGYPADDYLAALHPGLVAVSASLGRETWTSDSIAGRLTEEWAGKLHLSAGIPVMVGAIDAHMGAVGGGVAEGVLVKVMGTSTCDMIVGPRPKGGERLVRGICGQVDGSIVPGMLGYEAGQSAFGDVFAWFRDLLAWPLRAIPSIVPTGNARGVDIARRALEESILPALEAEAAKIDPATSSLVALDWLNGRRTPDADQRLSGAITGLTLGTTAPMVYRALVEATAFGSRAIAERFREEGVRVDRVIAVGGVAKKSPLAVQIVADVLGMPVEVVEGEQTVALGAAMFAAVGAGIHGSVAEAQARMKPGVAKRFVPDPARARVYAERYANYVRLGSFIEGDARAKG